MRKMQITKLLVVCKEKKKARLINFSNGLNIIAGENKTGKSSLIKSIFHTLGCKMDFEKDWTNLITDYFLYFVFDEVEYCIHRKGNENIYSIYFSDFRSNLIKDGSYTEFCEAFLQIFKIKIFLNNKDGKLLPLPPAAIFNYSYIDQDKGWVSKIPNNFNVNYLKQVNEKIIKFIVGEHTKKYFDLKTKIEVLNLEVDNYKKEITSIENFVKRVNSTNSSLEVNIPANDSKNIIDNMNSVYEKYITKEKNINSLLNEIHQLQKEIKFVKNIAINNVKDYEYSKKLNSEIVCPTCGTIHKNTFSEKLSIINEINEANDLLHNLREDLKQLLVVKKNELIELEEIKEQYNSLEVYFELIKNNSPIVSEIMSIGKEELALQNNIEIENMNIILSKKQFIINQHLNRIKKLESRKRKDFIRKQIVSLFNEFATELKVNLEHITFRNYKPKLNDSNKGSDGPRAVLAYYTSLYFYNLQRVDYPFKFIVVDTPNQQGQDDESLKSIHSFIRNFNSTKGQAIIGTERLTGHEAKANLIWLEQKQKCLNEEDYKHYSSILDATEKSPTF